MPSTTIDRYDTLKSNGGIRVGPLASYGDGLIGGTIALSEDHRDECTLVVDRARAQTCRLREVLRITESSGDVSEWVVRRIVTTDRETATIVCDPAWFLLATARAIRVPGLFVATNRITLTETPENILSEYLMAYKADDGYNWLRLGTIEPTDLITLDVDIVSPLGLIHAVVAAIPNGAVWTIDRDGDTGYLLNIWRTLPSNTVRAAVGDDITALVVEQDVKDTVTVAEPVGRDTGAGRVTIAEAAWKIIAITPTTIRVADPGTLVSPFVAPNQAAGWYVRRGLQTWGIVVTSAIDGTLTLAGGATGLALDDVITFDADVFGRPVTMLDDFAATMLYGRIHRILRYDFRPERTLLRNPKLTGTAVPWTNVNGTTATVIAREDLGVTLAGAAAASRAAATSTATPLATDGWTPGQRFYRLDSLEVSPVSLDITADAVPNSSGALTLTVAAPGLPAAYAGGAELTLHRLERRTWTVDGAQTTASGGVNTLHFTDSETDGLDDGIWTLTVPPWVFHPTVVYTNGISGAVTAYWGGVPAGAPTSWTNGQLVTAERVRETRTLLLSGAHAANATTITLQAVPALASHAWTTADTITVDRSFAKTVVITAAVDNGDGTITCAVDVAASDLDNVTPGDRDNLAQVQIAGSFFVDNGPGTGYSTSVVAFTLAGISGSTMTLYWDAAGGALTIFALAQSQTAAAAWAISSVYPVTSAASFGNNGRVTLPVTIPSGDTIPRGTRVTASWGTSRLFVYATVVGPASSIELLGTDAYTDTWDGVTAADKGVYRVFASDSTLEILGDSLVVAANAVANGAGAASLTLLAANTNAILDNAPLRIVRPALVPLDSPQTGSMIRLGSATGGTDGEPIITSPGIKSEPIPVRVDVGSTRPFAAWVRFVIAGPTTLAPGEGPVIAAVANGVIAAFAALEKETTFAQPINIVTLLCSTVLTATSTMEVRAYGGSSVDAGRHHYVDRANSYVGTDELLPVTDSPPANFGWHAANKELAARARPLQSVQVTRRNAKGALRRAWERPITVGTRVLVDGNAGVTAMDLRAVSTVRDLVDDHNTSVVLSTETQRLTAKLVGG